MKTIQAHHYLQQFIPQGVKQVFAEDFGLRRAKYLLNLLGNPQNKIKVIHLAGTSGKGSTAIFISHLLQSHNFTVGLSISPHLLDVRERFQINNQLISEEEFSEYLSEIMPAIEKMKDTEFKKPTYFEITTALMFYIFWKKKVDYAVVETGLGGWYDATNTVDREDKVVVITKIGFDHTKILGNTLSKIAVQKAMITQKGNHVITTTQKPTAATTIEKIIREQGGRLTLVSPRGIKYTQGNVSFDFNFQDIQFNKLTLNTKGLYQAENATLALAVLWTVSKRDNFKLKEENVRSCLGNLIIHGRLEEFGNIIVDGAHNPQKMQAFTLSLNKQYPEHKFQFLIAFKQSKDYKKMLKYIMPLAKKITITSFASEDQGIKTQSIAPEEIAKALKKHNFQEYEIIADPEQAYQKIIKTNQKVIITGSLYLISILYKHFNDRSL